MKHLLLSLVLGLMASNAYATQARLIALGMDELDDEGSYYIKDSRNIFLNSAFVNDFADRVIVEWGSTGYAPLATSGNSTVERDSNPKAQGGFLKKSGDFVYGVYYGNESNTSSFLRIAGSGVASVSAGAAAGAGATSGLLSTSDNQIDLFLGSELSNGLQWGANIVYTDSEDEIKKIEDSGSAVRLGVKSADEWDFHVNLSTSNKSERTGDATQLNALGWTTQTGVKDEFKGKFGIHVGGSYAFDFGRLFGYVKTFTWEQKDGFNYTGAGTLPAGAGTLAGQEVGKSGTSDGKFTTIELGWGRAESVSSTSTLFYSLSVKKVDVELELAKKVEVNNTSIPLVLGYEVEANSWLTLRGAIRHNVWGVKDNKNFNSANIVARNLVKDVYGDVGKGSIPNSTVVTAGASLTFGDLSVDGMIGTNNAASKTDGDLHLDRFMTTVAMTYLF